jgi:hypothetical protein
MSVDTDESWRGVSIATLALMTQLMEKLHEKGLLTREEFNGVLESGLTWVNDMHGGDPAAPKAKTLLNGLLSKR